MPADPRALAQEAIELAGKATPGPWRSSGYLGGSYAIDQVAPNGDRRAHVANALGFHASAEARLIAHAGTHYATIARALIEALDERDKLLAALPHALGICKCERQEWDETRQLPPWPVEHEAAIEWLRGRIE